MGNDWKIVGIGDFNGNGTDDFLWRSTTGQIAVWPSIWSSAGAWYPGGNGDTSWTVLGTGDFDGDGKSDILWRAATGQVAIWWSADGPSGASYPGGNGDTTWKFQTILRDLAY